MVNTKNLALFAAVLLATNLGNAASKVAEKLPLVPYPQEIQIQKGNFIPAKHLSIIRDASIAETAETFAMDLSEIGFTVAQGSTDPSVDVSVIKLEIRNDKKLGKEGYSLSIGSDVSISAATNDGLFWGTRTLLQLMHAGPGSTIQYLTIADQPEFPYRGLMIDNARNFHSIDFHIETIKRMASYKLNKYMIHFSDHQSYTLPSATFPNLPTKGRHFTREDITKLMDVSRRYHVMLVPEIDVPGHSGALIRAIPSLGSGHRGNQLCIGNEETYQTLEKLFAEVMEMMPGTYWHLGADEVNYNGTKCVDCVARMEKEKLKSGDQLFNYFINRMHGFIKGKNREMLVWEGFSPSVEPNIHQDIIVCPFDVKFPGKMPSDYFEAGYTVLNTSWTPLYVADKIDMTTPEMIARWSPYMFGAGRSPQPFNYWKKFNPEKFQGRILGAQMCSWAIEEKAEEGLLFGTGLGFPEYGRPGKRLPIMAERVWTGSATTTEDLLERVGESYWKKTDETTHVKDAQK